MNWNWHVRASETVSRGSGALFGLAAFALFSLHDVIVKVLGATYSSFQIVFFSALLSFPFITLALIRDQTPGTLQPVHPYWMALRSVAGVVSAVSVFYALGELPLSEVYAFIFASPLLITVLAIPILGETVRLRRGLAVVVGLIGVLIVVRPGSAPFTDGHIAALVGAIASSLASVIVRKIGSDERGVVMVLYPMMTNLALAGVALPFIYVEVPLADIGLFALDAVLVLAAMGTLVAAYRRGAAITVAPMQYSQMIWATLYGAVLFSETPAWQTYLGAAIIAASGLYILKREATGKVSQHAPVSETRTRMGHSITFRVGQWLSHKRDKE